MTKCVVHRKALLEALEAVKRVIWSHGVKEVLKCVHLQVVDGKLEVWATDLEVAMKLFVPAEGELDACLVNHVQLLNQCRIK
jgi:DNA polymerase III sliding clamp (beta) subunit (PCNA family)